MLDDSLVVEVVVEEDVVDVLAELLVAVELLEDRVCLVDTELDAVEVAELSVRLVEALVSLLLDEPPQALSASAPAASSGAILYLLGKMPFTVVSS